MKKTKAQKKRKKMIKEKERLKALESSEDKFVIEAVNGIEIAYADRIFEDIVAKESIQRVEALSKIAIDQYEKEGRGSFLVVTEVNPNEFVYLSSKVLLECIKQLIPEALNYVRKIVNEYNPHEKFVAINIFSDKRIAITRDDLRVSAA